MKIYVLLTDQWPQIHFVCMIIICVDVLLISCFFTFLRWSTDKNNDMCVYMKCVVLLTVQTCLLLLPVRGFRFIEQYHKKQAIIFRHTNTLILAYVSAFCRCGANTIQSYRISLFTDFRRQTWMGFSGKSVKLWAIFMRLWVLIVFMCLGSG